jgi:hypothetical protein
MKILVLMVLLLASAAYAWDDDTVLVDDRHGNIVPVDTGESWTTTQVGNKTVWNYDGTTIINNQDGLQTFINKWD